MSNKFEAEAIILALMAGDTPSEGDLIVRGAEGFVYESIEDVVEGKDITVNNLQVDGDVGVHGTAPAPQPTGYTTFANLTEDRTLDADATTVDELADVLGTLIEDLKSNGYVGA